MLLGVSSLAGSFPVNQHTIKKKNRQPPVELTSILVPSHRLRITALLSSGCKTTFEGLPNVQSSSTTQQWQSYSYMGWRQSSKIFHFRSIKSYSTIPLFRIPRFTSLVPRLSVGCLRMPLMSQKSWEIGNYCVISV